DLALDQEQVVDGPEAVLGVVVLNGGVEEVPPQVTPAPASGEAERGDGVVVLGAAVDDETDTLDTERLEDGGGMLTLLCPREGEERLAPVGEHPQAAVRELAVRAVLHREAGVVTEQRPGL